MALINICHFTRQQKVNIFTISSPIILQTLQYGSTLDNSFNISDNSGIRQEQTGMQCLGTVSIRNRHYFGFIC